MPLLTLFPWLTHLSLLLSFLIPLKQRIKPSAFLISVLLLNEKKMSQLPTVQTVRHHKNQPQFLSSLLWPTSSLNQFPNINHNIKHCLITSHKHWSWFLRFYPQVTSAPAGKPSWRWGTTLVAKSIRTVTMLVYSLGRRQFPSLCKDHFSVGSPFRSLSVAIFLSYC